MRQGRAVRTRESLIRAAADAFDTAGFEATSLGRICAEAGTSMGALTFHFRSKAALADAVQQHGIALTGEVVQRIFRTRQPALETIIVITLAVVDLLEDSSVVRAAARLSRERVTTTVPWSSSWLPVVEDLVTRVPVETLSPGTHPRALLSLVSHLVTGAEVLVHTGGEAAGPEHIRAVTRVAEIWELTLRGVSPTVRLPQQRRAGARTRSAPGQAQAVEGGAV
ncbi:TetR family transcriptional regulator [Streptomyces sp. NPDC085946]|uniref:TetR family transcriptional regulator n=1 Tax=Streptomyces sp. NPDC085946 TaxID=3365744 RepID=UPI0037D8D3A2